MSTSRILSLISTLSALSLVGADPGPGPPSRSSAPSAASDPLSQTRLVGAGLLRTHDSATHRAPIDVGAECVFLLLGSGPGLTLEARSPAGKTFSSKRDEAGAHGASTDEALEFLGPMEFLQIEHPETGDWTLTVTAGGLPDSVSSVAYQLKLIQNTGGKGPQLLSLVSEEPRHRGDSLLVRASLLEDGKPVPGARVEAMVGGEGGDEARPVRLHLLDDGRPPDAKAGDGIYSARAPQLGFSGFGVVDIEASRRGMKGFPDFDRSVEGHFQVAASRSRLTGAIRDVARDDDHDGLNESIVFLVGVHATDRASLRLLGTIHDSKGKEVSSFAESKTFEPGEHELELRCDTDNMKGPAPGPLTLDSLTLFEEETLARLDHATPHYKTRPYAARELMHDAIRIVDGNGTAKGVDLDGDGKFDALDVEIGIEIRFPGRYYCTGDLEIGDERLSKADIRVPFVEGRNVMKFRFPGACIASSRTTAAYRVGGIYVGYEIVPGDTRPSPRYGYTAWAVNLDGGPAPVRFEPTQLPSTRDDSHDCY